MRFELAFHPEALREWQKLTAGIREQFKKKLAERLIEPSIPASKLRGSRDRYKIKLRSWIPPGLRGTGSAVAGVGCGCGQAGAQCCVPAR